MGDEARNEARRPRKGLTAYALGEIANADALPVQCVIHDCDRAATMVLLAPSMRCGGCQKPLIYFALPLCARHYADHLAGGPLQIFEAPDPLPHERAIAAPVIVQVDDLERAAMRAAPHPKPAQRILN